MTGAADHKTLDDHVIAAADPFPDDPTKRYQDQQRRVGEH
jgi:hypothetical protein